MFCFFAISALCGWRVRGGFFSTLQGQIIPAIKVENMPDQRISRRKLGMVLLSAILAGCRPVQSWLVAPTGLPAATPTRTMQPDSIYTPPSPVSRTATPTARAPTGTPTFTPTSTPTVTPSPTTTATPTQRPTLTKTPDRAAVGTPLIGVIAHKVYAKALQTVIDGQVDDYGRAIALAGGAPILIPQDLDEKGLARIYASLDGLLFPGGGDVDPAFYNESPAPNLGWVDRTLDQTELTLAGWALTDWMPVLGICRGIQLLNVAAGGTLYQDLPSQYPGVLPHNSRQVRAHIVQLDAQSKLATTLGVLQCATNSRHHQAVKDVAPGFVASAHTQDGVIEGIEHKNMPFCIGVQWHPENLVPDDAAMMNLFLAFVQAAKAKYQKTSLTNMSK